jgi:hypothetical protein
MKNQQIAIITAGILAAGLMAMSSFGTSVWAASAGSSGSISLLGGINFANSAAAAPGQAAASAFGFQQLLNPQQGLAMSSAASDTQHAHSAGGLGALCGTGQSANVGTCANTRP